MADKLIANRQFDDAIKLLNEYAENNPEKFFRIQKRIRKIVLRRDQYNALAEELLDVLINDPENSERILGITKKLDQMEPSRGILQEFLAHTEELAQFRYNRSRLEEIMLQGRKFLDQGDYAAAMNCYAGGLDIYQAEFFAAGYGEMIDNQVRNGLATITNGVADFNSLIGPVKNVAARMDQLGRQTGADDAIRLQRIYARISPLLEQLITLNRGIAGTGNFYEKQLALFQESDLAYGDRSYLSFASRLIFGRGETDIQEGILGSIAGLWNSVLSPLETSLNNLTEQAYTEAYAAVEAQKFSQTYPQFDRVISLCTMAMDFISKSRRFYEGQDFPAQYYFETGVLTAQGEDFLRYYSMRLAAQTLMQAESLMEEYSRLAAIHSNTVESWLRGTMGAQAAMTQEGIIRRSFHELALTVETILDQLNRDGRVLLEYRESLSGDRRFFPSLEKSRSFFADLDTNATKQEISSTIREYTIGNRDLEQRLTAWENEFNEAMDLFNGNRITGEGEDYLARYPSEALALFTGLSSTTAEGLALAHALIARYDAEEFRIINDSRINELSLAARAMVTRAENFHSQALSMERNSRVQVAQAETFRLDGDRLYQEARSALAQNNFDIARDRILRSGERYDESLVIQESSALRRTRDTQLVNLGMEITRLENEAIVREVRTLVNTARDTYFNGNFERAEDYLIRAMSRWRRTNVEDDAELTYWLTLVRGAMSLRAGRTIPVTAPLYAEMSQLLSDAKKNYDDGIRLINGNRSREGFAKFTEARQKTQGVRIMFPVNQEASLLELRMDQITDPQAFNESFQRRLSTAVMGTKRGSVESFADLQNLAEINPNYPGIRGMVAQAEIDLGYRPAPPDVQALARSNELTAAARGIINRNVRSQFPVALEQLNRALLLNPSNNQAMSLKDRVQIELGGGGSVVLSSTAEREYQRAIQELQQGNTLVAMTIVRQLLQDPKNRNSTRILELQRRIESVL